MSKQEIEVIEQDIETAPDAGGLVTQSVSDIETMIALSENIDRAIAAQNKIRAALMKLAQPGDWVKFGDKAEIGFAGAMRIGSTIGVNFTNWTEKKEKDRDELGEWYRWEYECDVTYSNRTIRVYGRAGSRDKFFGKAYGNLKPLHEVDEGNIKMAARRAAMKEGVKVLFGLHHMDPSYLSKFGINLEEATGYDHKESKSVGKGNTGKISEPQRKRLFAIMKGSDKKEDLLKIYLKDNYSIESSNDILWKDYNDICEWIQTPLSNGEM